MTVSRRWWWRATGMMWLAVIGWLTLRSAPAHAAQVSGLPWFCVVCGDGGAADVLLNVLLFLPLGVVARQLRWPLRRTVLWVMVLSTAIETVQGTLLVGRDAALGDVMANMLGGVSGWLAVPLLAGLRRPSRVTARRAAAVTVAIMALLWTMTGEALQLDLSHRGPWVGQVLHLWPGHDPFPGRVTFAAIDDIDIVNDPIAQMPRRRDSLDLVMDLVRASPQVPARPASILRLVDALGKVQLAATQDGQDIDVEVRLRGSAWRLHTPSWVLDGGGNVTVGVPWRLRWQRTAARVQFSSTVTTPGAVPRSATVIPITLGLGWVFIHPFVTKVGSNALLWTTLWLAWWFGLAGWLGGWSGRRGNLACAAVLIATMVTARAVTGTGWRQAELLAAAIAYGAATAAASRCAGLLNSG